MNFREILIFLCIFCASLPAVSQNDESNIHRGTKIKCSGVVQTSSEIIDFNKKIPSYQRIREQFIFLDFIFIQDAVYFEYSGSNDLLVTQCFAKSAFSGERAECNHLVKTYNSKLEKFTAVKTRFLENLVVKSSISFVSETRIMEVSQIESQILKNEKRYNNIKAGSLNCKFE